MLPNQVQVPVIQTDSKELTQVQQNVNKVLRNLNNQLVSVTNTVKQIQGLGDIILSGLGLAQFQAVHGKEWIQANGQSSVGTAYQSFSLNQTVPNVNVTNANSYIKVN